MHTLKLARAAICPLILGCSVGIGFPALADPPAESAAARDAAAPPVLSNGVGSQFELAFWQSVSSNEDRHQLEAYLAQYPNGTFSGLARAKISRLDRRSASDAAQDGSFAATATPAPATATPSRSEAAGNDLPAATGLPIAAASGPSVPTAAAAVASVETVKPALASPAPAATPSPSTPPPNQSSMSPSLAEQLRALGQSQGRRPQAPPSAPIPQCVQPS